MADTKRLVRGLLLGSAFSAVFAIPVYAQDQSQAPAQPAEPATTAVDEIVVVGTRIAGAKITAALPVVVVGEAKLDAIAAVSGD